jgi:DNA-binding transcriptional regulator YhcF (GntR family)
MSKRRPRKPWATDKSGRRELHFRHMAAELGMSEAAVRRAFDELEQAGLARKDGERLFLTDCKPSGGAR